jgi:FOG: Ankyrin repeat
MNGTVFKCIAGVVVATLIWLAASSRGARMDRIDYSEDFTSVKEKQIIAAIASGDIPEIKRLSAAGGNLQAVGAYENTPMRTALKLGEIKVVEALLQLGVDANFKTPGGTAAADITVTFQRDPKFLKLLLDHGLDPNLKSEGVPLIFFATTEGLWPQYEMLLAKGADINSRNEDGSSLLLDLVLLMQYDRAKDLLLKGADYKPASITGLNVLDLLVDYQRRMCIDPDLPDCHKRAELLRLLRERGANVPEGLPYM